MTISQVTIGKNRRVNHDQVTAVTSSGFFIKVLIKCFELQARCLATEAIMGAKTAAILTLSTRPGFAEF